MSDGYWDNSRACTQAGGGGAAVNTDKNGHQCEGTFDDSVFNAASVPRTSPAYATKAMRLNRKNRECHVSGVSD